MGCLSRWLALVVVGGFCVLAAGCGTRVARVSSCGNPAYTFTLPGGRRVSAGDCAGYLSGLPQVVRMRPGETFTLRTGDAAIPVGPPVPLPNAPAVRIISIHRTPHRGATATYRAIQPGRAMLVVRHETFCLPGPPHLGQSVGRYRRQSKVAKRPFLRRYRQEEQAQKQALDSRPRNCLALAIEVTG